MKKNLFCLFILLSSCQDKHFQFDNIDHYKINISDNDLNILLSKENKSDKENDLVLLLSEDFIDDNKNELVTHLNELYPYKQKINEPKISELKAIYHNSFNFSKSKCIPVYRDILIFKQDDSILGISKICFDCNMQYTIKNDGKNIEIDNSDFEKLEKILN